MEALEFINKINSYFAHIFFQYHLRLDIILIQETIGGYQSKTPIHATKHLIGSRQRLLQTVARKVAWYLEALSCVVYGGLKNESNDLQMYSVSIYMLFL